MGLNRDFVQISCLNIKFEHFWRSHSVEIGLTQFPLSPPDPKTYFYLESNFKKNFTDDLPLSNVKILLVKTKLVIHNSNSEVCS